MSEENAGLTAQIVEQIVRDGLKDPNAIVHVYRDTLGWLRLQVVSVLFADRKLEERIDAVNQTLQKQGLTLNSYPLGGFRLGAPNEGKLEQLELLPSWSEALLEPEREQEAPPQESTPASPIVVTFYSFRGGVGRSTALAITAGLLARLNYRVVIVDLDLEAPGLSFLLIGDAQSDEATLRDGVLEFLYQRSLPFGWRSLAFQKRVQNSRPARK